MGNAQRWNDQTADGDMQSSEHITGILNDLSGGDETAADRLLPLVYDELRRLATHCLQQERPGHTLQPTALVHEAYLRLIDQTRTDWTGRAHFRAVASTMIRRILVDHARTRDRHKRGGGRERVSLDVAAASFDVVPDDVDLIALDEALDQLGELNERQRRVVELRYFGGLGVEEAAHVLGISPSTVKTDWRLARAWLKQRLQD